MKINKFMQAININPAKKAEETFPKTKPMPADSVSFSHSVKPSNDQKFIELREDISKKMQPLLSGSEEAGWDFYINSTAENMDKMNAAQDKVNEFYDDKEVYKKLKAINDNGGVEDKKLQKAKNLRDECENTFNEIQSLIIPEVNSDLILKEINSLKNI